MNQIRTTLAAALLAGVSSVVPEFSAMGQGALTPPGAPAPLMKTLDQVEARTPVDAAHTPGDSSSVFIINRSGSYYLTTNVLGVSSKYGIQIFANNVALDLNGYSLIGVSNALDGIVLFNSYTNLTVRNGTISGWGTGNYGIRCLGQNATLERLNVSGNNFGLTCVGGSVIRDCVIDGSGRDGLFVQGSGNLIVNNNLSGNNLLSGPGNASISIVGINNRIEGNHVAGNGGGFGILISAGPYTNNFVIRNSVTGNGVNNYSLGTGNIAGPLINNTVSGTITNANPWANFSF